MSQVFTDDKKTMVHLVVMSLPPQHRSPRSPLSSRSHSQSHPVCGSSSLLIMTVQYLGMCKMYLIFVTSCQLEIKKAIAPLADPLVYPAVIHCIHGKDRTGVCVALVLALLGVPKDAILEDYSRSQAEVREQSRVGTVVGFGLWVLWVFPSLSLWHTSKQSNQTAQVLVCNFASPTHTYEINQYFFYNANVLTCANLGCLCTMQHQDNFCTRTW